MRCSFLPTCDHLNARFAGCFCLLRKLRRGKKQLFLLRELCYINIYMVKKVVLSVSVSVYRSSMCNKLPNNKDNKVKSRAGPQFYTTFLSQWATSLSASFFIETWAARVDQIILLRNQQETGDFSILLTRDSVRISYTMMCKKYCGHWARRRLVVFY